MVFVMMTEPTSSAMAALVCSKARRLAVFSDTDNTPLVSSDSSASSEKAMAELMASVTAWGKGRAQLNIAHDG